MRLDMFAAAAMTFGLLATNPALAHEGIGPELGHHMAPYLPYEDTEEYGYDSPAREAWLADCRQRLALRDSAGRGWQIDRAEEARRSRVECETYLDDYYARYVHGGPQGYGGYAYPGMGTPMMMVPGPGTPRCTETVEYVYEDAPPRPAPRKRYIPRPDKRKPDKRVPVR